MFNERNFENRVINSVPPAVEDTSHPSLAEQLPAEGVSVPQPEAVEKKVEQGLEEDKAKQSDKELDQAEANIRPEIEKQFQEVLSALHPRIQLKEMSLGRFPKQEELLELIDITPILQSLTEFTRKSLAIAIEKDKDFHTDNPEEFVKKGMEHLAVIIHLEVIKKAGDQWLQEKADALSQGNSKAGTTQPMTGPETALAVPVAEASPSAAASNQSAENEPRTP